MVYATLSGDMIELLKQLKFSNFISYECGKINNTAYGNLRINTDKGSVELSNIEREIPFFDITEEVACFECKVSDPSTEFKPYCIEPFDVFKIGEKIKNIAVINDAININDGEYEISFDRAIIFRTDKKDIMFSRDIWFSEVITNNENDDSDAVYPAHEVIDAWSEQGVNKVDVIRTVREL